MLEFFREVSDSEQRKRAVLNGTRAALNVILLHCTKLRTFSQPVYGDCIFPGWLKPEKFTGNLLKTGGNRRLNENQGMLRRPSMGRPQKNIGT